MKWLLRFALTIIIIIAIGIGYIFYVINYQKKDIISFVVGKINEQLVSKVDVKDIDISLLKSFPNASLTFKDIVIYEKTKQSSSIALIKLSELNLGLNIWDVLNKKYILKTCKANNGIINISYFEDGSDNFHFWKNDTSNTNTNSIFKLNELILNNIKLNYTDKKTNTLIEITNNELKLIGDFSKSTSLAFSQLGKLNSLKIGDFELPKNKNLAINTAIIINNNLITIAESDVNYASIQLDAKGNINNEKLTFSFKVKNKKACSIIDLMSLLPNKYTSELSKYQTNGNIIIDANIDKATNLIIKASILTTNASLTEPASNTKLNDVSFKASYDNSFNNGYLDIQDLKANLNDGTISGNLTISNFENPILIAKINALLNLADIKNIAHIDTLSLLTGKINANINYKGPAKITEKTDYNKIAEISGLVTIDNLKLKFKQDTRQLNSDSCILQFNKTDILFNKLSAQIGKTDLLLNGEIKNILPFLLGDDNQLNINAAIKSNFFDLNDILDNNPKNKQSIYNISIPKNLTCQFIGNINTFRFNKFEASNIKGDILLQNQELKTNGIVANAIDGKLTVRGAIKNTVKNILNTSATVDLENINVKKLLYQFQNFGQNYLMDKHVEGVLNTNLSLNANWNSALIVDYKSIQCVADVNIKNGQLLNFEPMLNLSKFVALDDLKNVKFSELKNTILVKNEKIIIPQMDILSNTINISMQGTHTFDNVIDYHISLLLNDLLAKKAKSNKRENSEFGTEEEDGTGKLNLFLSIKGTTANPKITYDKIGLKQQLKNNLASEKETIKNLFKKDKNNNTSNTNNTKAIGVDWNNKPDTKTEANTQPKTEKKKEKPKWLKNNKEKQDQNTEDFN